MAMISMIASTIASDDSFDDLDDDLSDHADDFSAEIEEAINNPIELGLDFYSREGLDAYRDNEIFEHCIIIIFSF